MTPPPPKTSEEWVRILNNAAHDINHLVEPSNCPDCLHLMSRYGPMPDHMELIAAQLTRHYPKPISKYSKVAIPDSLRWDVWERDNFTCQECGVRRFLSVDHIVPESRGGTLDLGNLRTLCQRCNSKKGNRHDGSNG